MNGFKEFTAKYLTGMLSVLIVLNVVIVLFAVMGLEWQQMLRVPVYLMDIFSDQTHLMSRSNTTNATINDGSGGHIKTASGIVTSPDIQLVCSDETFAAAVSKVRPAVVNISCESIGRAPASSRTLQFDDPAQDLLSLGGIGSGMIIDSRGYILTCYHMVSRSSSIIVTPFGYDVRRYRATVIAKDESLNLAVLRISTPAELPTVTLGDSAQTEVADVVLAIGSPFGLEQSVTHGIISDTSRDLQIGDIIYRRMMQTDVPINRGSSGGPLINVNGEVIGINMAIYSPTGVYSGVSFAMPVNQAKRLLAKTIQ